MDEDVDQVISPDIGTAGIIIQGKGEIRQYSPPVWTGCGYLPEPFKGESINFKLVVFFNIGCIIKNKRELQCVCIQGKYNGTKNSKNYAMIEKGQGTILFLFSNGHTVVLCELLDTFSDFCVDHK